MTSIWIISFNQFFSKKILKTKIPLFSLIARAAREASKAADQIGSSIPIPLPAPESAFKATNDPMDQDPSMADDKAKTSEESAPMDTTTAVPEAQSANLVQPPVPEQPASDSTAPKSGDAQENMDTTKQPGEHIYKKYYHFYFSPSSILILSNFLLT